MAWLAAEAQAVEGLDYCDLSFGVVKRVAVSLWRPPKQHMFAVQAPHGVSVPPNSAVHGRPSVCGVCAALQGVLVLLGAARVARPISARQRPSKSESAVYEHLVACSAVLQGGLV
jgi:hypothetical protein